MELGKQEMELIIHFQACDQKNLFYSVSHTYHWIQNWFLKQRIKAKQLLFFPLAIQLGKSSRGKKIIQNSIKVSG